MYIHFRVAGVYMYVYQKDWGTHWEKKPQVFMFFVFLNRKANLDKVFFSPFLFDTKQTPKKKIFFF